MSVIVLGGGAFGTSIATVLARKNLDATLLVRTEEHARAINVDRCNHRYLPDFRLPRRVRASTRAECVSDARVILLTVPSHSVLSTVRAIRPYLAPGACVLNLAKGLHAEYVTMDRALAVELPGVVIGSLKGPNFARPMLHGASSGMTLAVDHDGMRSEVADMFAGSTIQIEHWHGTGDVEFVSAMKNVLAIAMGICDAIEDNPNTRFMVVHKIINEARRLLRQFEYDADVLFTYAGFGDLLMTALNDTSRNRTLGLLIGRGFDFNHQESGPVLEGRRSTHLLCSRLRDEDQLSIVKTLDAVFEGAMSPQEFHKSLTCRA